MAGVTAIVNRSRRARLHGEDGGKIVVVPG